MTVEERLLEQGFSGVKIFKNFSYDSAFLGVTSSGRAVYSYEKMVEWLKSTQGFSEEEAEDWISYNSEGAIGDLPGDPEILYEF